jgi:hypothetical protein
MNKKNPFDPYNEMSEIIAKSAGDGSISYEKEIEFRLLNNIISLLASISIELENISTK